jgi:hypothetical protein
MQTKEEIEKHYEIPDPWGYQTNPDDIERKERIIEVIKKFDPYPFFALDVGCGEGWITKDIPATIKYGYEMSDNAISRLPKNVIPFILDETTDEISEYKLGYHIQTLNGFDLVIATGILYGHYNYRHFINIINKYAGNLIVTCNIKNWEVKEIDQIQATQIYEEEFPYREYVQKLRVFKK